MVPSTLRSVSSIPGPTCGASRSSHLSTDLSGLQLRGDVFEAGGVVSLVVMGIAAESVNLFEALATEFT